MSLAFVRDALAGCLLASLSTSAGSFAPPAAVNHIAIHVENLDASERFYRDVLGLKPMPTQLSPTMKWLATGGFELHLIGGRTRPVETPREVHLAFRVSDLRPITAKLDGRRVSWGNFAGESGVYQLRGDGVLQIYFRDPDGYWIEVNQLPKKAPPKGRPST